MSTQLKESNNDSARDVPYKSICLPSSKNQTMIVPGMYLINRYVYQLKESNNDSVRDVPYKSMSTQLKESNNDSVRDVPYKSICLLSSKNQTMIVSGMYLINRYVYPDQRIKQ